MQTVMGIGIFLAICAFLGWLVYVVAKTMKGTPKPSQQSEEVTQMSGGANAPAKNWKTIVGWSFVGVIGLYACSSGNGGAPQPKLTPLQKLEAKIGPDAVVEMGQQDYQKTYAKLGSKQFEQANSLMKWAGIAAAENEKCDKVELVGISDDATRHELKWYVDCANKDRFMITQGQATATRDRLDPSIDAAAREKAKSVAVAEPKSERWKNFKEANAVTACDLLVQKTMLVPDTFDSAWRWDTFKNEKTGIVTIERDFTSENAYGMEINSRYRCAVDADKGGLKSLHVREPDGWKKMA